MNRSITLYKPPNETAVATVCSLTQIHVEQIDTLWRAVFREVQQPDVSWDWAYKLRLALSDRRYEAYAIELDELSRVSRCWKPTGIEPVTLSDRPWSISSI